MTHKEALKLFFHNMPKTVLLLFWITIITWSWAGFKSIEPYIMPVVVDFKIETIHRESDAVIIYGTMDKRRRCDFKQVIGYHNNHLVNIEFMETTTDVTRESVYQNWGGWRLTPPVKEITILGTHECNTGTVVTILYEGDL